MSSSICEASPRRNLVCFSVHTVPPDTQLGSHVHRVDEQEWELTAIECAAEGIFLEFGES